VFKYACALVAAATAMPVLAQDAPLSFNGPFIGVQGGWQQDRQALNVNGIGFLSSDRQNKDGFAYGGQIGYDFRLSPQVVLGAEVALTGRTGSSLLNYNSEVELTQGRTIAATARLGYIVGNDGLVYARGGYANARYNVRTRFSDISENRGGYQIGAGYEQTLRQNVSARIEYAYSRFGSASLPGLAAGIGANDAQLKYSRNAVTAGLNFRF